MSLGRMKKAEGGHKRGHSSMSHWFDTSEIKEVARLARRVTDRSEIAWQVGDLFAEPIEPGDDLWYMDSEDFTLYDYYEWKWGAD